MSLVALMVPVLPPPALLKSTVAPPVVIAFPAASRAWSVRVAPPPERIVPEEVETVDVAVAITPGFTVIEVVEVTAFPPIVAWIVVAEPEATPVNVAV